MSEDSVIFLAEVNSSQAGNKSAVQATVSPSPVVVPEENVAGEGVKESPVGGPEGPIEVSSVCETEAGTEADVEVVLLVAWTKLGFLGTILRDSRSQRSFAARDLRRKCPRVSLTPLTFHNVSFQIFIKYNQPSCGNFFAGHSLNSIGLVMLRALEHEDDFVRLLCFSVQSLRRTCGSCQ